MMNANINPIIRQAYNNIGFNSLSSQAAATAPKKSRKTADDLMKNIRLNIKFTGDDGQVQNFKKLALTCDNLEDHFASREISQYILVLEWLLLNYKPEVKGKKRTGMWYSNKYIRDELNSYGVTKMIPVMKKVYTVCKDEHGHEICDDFGVVKEEMIEVVDSYKKFHKSFNLSSVDTPNRRLKTSTDKLGRTAGSINTDNLNHDVDMHTATGISTSLQHLEELGLINLQERTRHDEWTSDFIWYRKITLNFDKIRDFLTSTCYESIKASTAPRSALRKLHTKFIIKAKDFIDEELRLASVQTKAKYRKSKTMFEALKYRASLAINKTIEKPESEWTTRDYQKEANRKHLLELMQLIEQEIKTPKIDENEPNLDGHIYDLQEALKKFATTKEFKNIDFIEYPVVKASEVSEDPMWNNLSITIKNKINSARIKAGQPIIVD